jgi:hypothetical protein
MMLFFRSVRFSYILVLILVFTQINYLMMKRNDFKFANSYLNNYFLLVDFRFNFETLLFYFFHLFSIIIADVDVLNFESPLILVHYFQLLYYLIEVGFSYFFYGACEVFQLKFSNYSF